MYPSIVAAGTKKHGHSDETLELPAVNARRGTGPFAASIFSFFLVLAQVFTNSLDRGLLAANTANTKT